MKHLIRLATDSTARHPVGAPGDTGFICCAVCDATTWSALQRKSTVQSDRQFGQVALRDHRLVARLRCGHRRLQAGEGGIVGSAAAGRGGAARPPTRLHSASRIAARQAMQPDTPAATTSTRPPFRRAGHPDAAPGSPDLKYQGERGGAGQAGAAGRRARHDDPEPGGGAGPGHTYPGRVRRAGRAGPLGARRRAGAGAQPGGRGEGPRASGMQRAVSSSGAGRRPSASAEEDFGEGAAAVALAQCGGGAPDVVGHGAGVPGELEGALLVFGEKHHSERAATERTCAPSPALTS